MPIQRVSTKPTSIQASTPGLEDDELSPETKSQVYTLIEAFLALNPSPEDVQVHALAAAVNIPKETFEAVMYELLAEVITSGAAIQASDPDGKLMENDGIPDEELLGEPDRMKEAGENDGAVDTELLLELKA